MATQTVISNLHNANVDNYIALPHIKDISSPKTPAAPPTVPLESVKSHSTAMKPSASITSAETPMAKPTDVESKPASSKPTPATAPPLGPFRDLIPGYPKLAGRMGIMPEIAMFRRFGALNARNSLYYQNELFYLKNELKGWEVEDAKSSEGKKPKYGLDAFWLNTADFAPNRKLRDGDMRQRELTLRIRCILKQYNDALIQQAEILRNMKEPDPFDLDDIQRFISSDQMKGFLGPDRMIWGSFKRPKDYSRELDVLRGRKDMDTFSRKISARAIDWTINLDGERWKKFNVRWGTVAVHDDTILKFTFWATSAIASVLPVILIIMLVNTNSLNE